MMAAEAFSPGDWCQCMLLVPIVSGVPDTPLVGFWNVLGDAVRWAMRAVFGSALRHAISRSIIVPMPMKSSVTAMSSSLGYNGAKRAVF